MKSNGIVIYITELQAKCNRMGWQSYWHSANHQVSKRLGCNDQHHIWIWSDHNGQAPNRMRNFLLVLRSSPLWKKPRRTTRWWLSASWRCSPQVHILASHLSGKRSSTIMWCTSHCCTRRSWPLQPSTQLPPPKPYTPIWGRSLCIAPQSKATSSSSTPISTPTLLPNHCSQCNCRRSCQHPLHWLLRGPMLSLSIVN